MSPDRLLDHLVSDSPRWLGEAGHHLVTAAGWVRKGRDLRAESSPLLAFYRCIHAFKGACSLMAERLPIAARITARLHEMEGRLAIRDHWKDAPGWIPQFEAELATIRGELQAAWQESCRRACEARLEGRGQDAEPRAVRALSGGRELVFPWPSILEFLPGGQVRGRPMVPVQGELLAVVPASGPAHEAPRYGVAVKTSSGARIVVPVEEIELLFESVPALGSGPGARTETRTAS